LSGPGRTAVLAIIPLADFPDSNTTATLDPVQRPGEAATIALSSSRGAGEITMQAYVGEDSIFPSSLSSGVFIEDLEIVMNPQIQLMKAGIMPVDETDN
jgi:hypothetical protein